MESLIIKELKIKYYILLFTLCCLASCGEYQQLLKSRDPEVKYEAAIRYFNEGEYTKAQTLLDDVSSYYKGTERAQDVLSYLARCYMSNKDYASAAEYYSAYLRNYPKGRYAMEARFQIGHCKYLDAPDPRLDQTITKDGIQYLQQFVELYPESPYAEQAYREMFELYDRLAQKELYSARLYYNLGTYLGNNYQSAEIIARNALRKYPGNAYSEELSWIILQAKYQQTILSFREKQEERARQTDDEYYNFVNDYPNTKYRKQADQIKKEIDKLLK